METLNTAQPVIEQCNHIPQLLNIKNVISYTGLSRSTIYEMIDESSKLVDHYTMIQRFLRKCSLHK